MPTTSSSTGHTTRPIEQVRCQPLLGVIAGVIVVGLVALVVTLVQDRDAASTPFDTAVAAAAGSALPSFEDPTADPAIGRVAPLVEGTDRDGNALVAPATGQATVLLFVAHWCPHCQAEAPVVQDWIEHGERPEGVDVVGVSTATRSNRPNYPPSAWLADEEWTVPTISDASGVAAMAYGATSFPFWVAVAADGTVVERRTGALRPGQITQLARVAGR
ncbi:MAG: TlpA family protein disulfide reductase [Acidimicrobiales bacterium]